MEMIHSQYPSPQIHPASIAAGIGLADRQEICGLLALLEVSGITETIKGLAETAHHKLRPDTAPESSRFARSSEALLQGPVCTDALKHRLWVELSRLLGTEGPLPFSVRRLRQDASAIGFRAAEVLKPSVIAARDKDAGQVSGVAARARSKLLRALPASGSRSSQSVSFPDVVFEELKALMNGLDRVAQTGDLDPEVATAIRKGQIAMSAATVAGGGWVAFASVVGSAGFAPYIFAAKLSAMIPFVSGPMLTSFLAVMINPVVVVAGTAALGFWAIRKGTTPVREAAAARVAVMLALSGMRDLSGGLAALATVFRGLYRIDRRDLTHMKRRDVTGLVLRTKKLEDLFGDGVPPSISTAPGGWGQDMRSATRQGIADVALTGALSAGDMLYHAAAIDPSVLEAADFSRTLSVDDPLDLAVHVSAFAAKGAQIALRGYTAEQLVMARLVEQGHAVELASSSTMPGYDLVVDGIPVQVKCGANLSLLQEHFSKYPDMPVIANVDLARMAEDSKADWAHLVTTVDGFELDYVQSILDRSLEAAQNLGENVVPVYAMIVGGARAATKAWNGEIPVEDLPAWLVFDLSIRGGLATAGQAGGAFVGLLVIGPAGALILGPVMGVAALFGTGALHAALDRAIRSDWHDEVSQAADKLRQALLTALKHQVQHLVSRHDRLSHAARGIPADLQLWLGSRSAEDVISAWETIEDLPEATSLRGAMELAMIASAIGMADPEVLRARQRLLILIAAKPSTVESISRLGEGLGSAVQASLGKRLR